MYQYQPALLCSTAVLKLLPSNGKDESTTNSAGQVSRSEVLLESCGSYFGFLFDMLTCLSGDLLWK